ncbi:DUF1772 domain-containing protein [Vibrio penaeicida]|uniref:DUF1772 domain-containing protein n=1 Tax=Vibrio penaeicida TaxID=104609 RepID=UPI002735963B|nr:DUF1772 domain-containing protein [Vibrio penaeicida]MDP2574616.1 DUF1772 domain-containing protein [Vibrio penaeicida]
MEKGLEATSTLLLGLMAGFFATYSFNVNYAMLEVDGSTYATVQSLFNINVRHAGFFVCFSGAALLPAITGVVWLRKDKRQALVWLAIALSYFIGIVIFTRFVNLPLNYYTESWNPAALPDDWEDIRDQWNTANLLRVIVSMITFSIALVIPHLRTRSITR